MVRGGRHESYFKELIVLFRGCQTFSIKGQLVNIFSFVDHMVSCNDSTLPLSRESSHRQYGNKWARLCSNKTLLKKPSLAQGL